MNWIEDIFRRYYESVREVCDRKCDAEYFNIPLSRRFTAKAMIRFRCLLNGTSTSADWDTVMNNSLFYGNGHLLVICSAADHSCSKCSLRAPRTVEAVAVVFLLRVLFLGCIAGFRFFVCVQRIPYRQHVYSLRKNFALMGMAGLMSGVMHAPLDRCIPYRRAYRRIWPLFLPLMIVSVCAYLTIIIFEPHSIYSMRLAKERRTGDAS